MRRLRWSIAAAFAAICVVAVIGWVEASQLFTERTEHQLDESLALVVPMIESEISRFSTLLEVLKEDPRISAALTQSGGADIDLLNDYLVHIRDHIGACELSVLDSSGTVIASSSWETTTIVGQHFGFRPYFRDAMETGSGRFFAIGMNTGVPGYFLASRINAGAVSGVVTIKVDFSDVEASWRKGGDDFALVDRSGVIFLTSRDDWKYRVLHPLTQDELAAIHSSHQYDGVDLTARSPLSGLENSTGSVSSLNGGGVLYRLRQIGFDGWRVIAARPSSGPVAAANTVALVIVLTGLVIAAAGYLHWQRIQFARVRNEHNVLLERRVEERTRELAEEVAIRRRTEQSLRDTECDLVQATKLATLGQMSAALAHEVSQPVTALAAMLTAAERRLEAGEAESGLALVIRAESLTRRIQHIIRHLRSFARKQKGDRSPMSIAASITEALELAETRAHEIGVSIETRGLDSAAEVFGNPVRIEQVLINVLLNALDAVVGRARREVGIDLGADETWVTIRVWDTGPGIPEGLAESVARPFFTTKAGQDGLGLGLSISQSILSEYGASMHFSSREGGGTVCEVRLPALVEGAGTRAAE